uniref:Tryptophan aminotransferase-related protein 2 n=1 Tax=Anthurium amnicola TaxID=1678845 RepID=A0A1D1XRS1_9ARAE
MAKVVSVGGVRRMARKERERNRWIPINHLYLAGVVTLLLSLTMNMVMFYRFQSLYKVRGRSSEGDPTVGASEMGEVPPEALLLSPHHDDVRSSSNGSFCAHQDGMDHVCLADEEHAGASSDGAPQQNGSTTTDCHSIVINLDHGDPTMYEPFWRAMEETSSIVIRSWQAMSYFSPAGSICWFMEPRLAREIVRLHNLVGNARTDGWHIVVGTGSTQLFQAALYALSPQDSVEAISVVSAAPYYSSYPTVTDFLRSGLYRWAGDAHSFDANTPYIELVCSPNNPDGFLREAVVNKETGSTIHDLAYYWPQYTPITTTASHDIMLFTFSKITGHAGTRIGWALVRDRHIAEKMTKFVELNTIGVSKDSQLRAAQILAAISDGYELPTHTEVGRFFDYGRRLMAERWERLRQVVQSADRFSLPDFPSANCSFTGQKTRFLPAFAWLRCEGKDKVDCQDFLRGHKILTRSGKHFGWGIEYVRVSMLDRDENFDLFTRRLTFIR